MRIDLLFLVFLGFAGLLWILALLAYFFPAKNPGSFYGYKSDRSRRNRKNWVFAQTLLPSIFFKVGAYLIIGALIWAFFELEGMGLGLIIMGVILLLGFSGEIFRSEAKLKRFSRERN